MKNRVYIIALLVLGIGIMLLFGTSYSLIMNGELEKEFTININDFNDSYNKNIKVNLVNNEVYTFSISNNSNTDINYRLDIIEYNTNDLDLINYKYSVNDGKYSDLYKLKDNYTIKQNKNLQSNATDIYKLNVLLSEKIKEDASFTILITATKNEAKYATDVIKKLSKNKENNVMLEDNNYRYNKNDSNNYVWFNCKNGVTKGENYCEKWRIIGAFNNKNDKSTEEYLSLKLVNTKVVNNIPFNMDEARGNYNDSYVSSYANGYYYDTLDEDTQKLILKAKWNIGEVNSNNYTEVVKEEKTKTYYAYIGLANISDYLYLQNESFIGDNTMFLNKTHGKVNILSKGIKTGDNYKSYSFVPVIYLRWDISFNSGDGSYSNPYELIIKYPMNY